MLEKKSITFLRPLKSSKLKKYVVNHRVKVFNTEKELHHFLMTGKLFNTNTEAVLHHHRVHPPTPFWWAAKVGGGGSGVEPLTKFLIKGGLTGYQILERGARKERRGVIFLRGEGLQVLLKK